MSRSTRSILIGKTLAQYEITSELGKGGMGEVYRATDTKLGRDVAIKVLPASFTEDRERLARFEREAKLLASLNHPNIAHVYGFESATLDDGSSVHFLAMELVEGEDLAERLKRGPIPVDEALEIAMQIAEALQEAHEHGIVHRDLKPANVKVTPDGKVKVLDFGLAKAYTGEGAAGSSADLSQSPTLAQTGTQAGIILGTAAYMSPEQASGRRVDKRTDIWAFGALLFEILTGKRPFAGDNVSEILASVLKEEPSWESLPEGTPRSMERLLKRCLRKKPRERLQDIGDARLEIEEARLELASGPAEGRTGPEAKGAGRGRRAWALAAALAAAAGLGAGWLLSRAPTRAALQLSVPLAPARLAGTFAVSPDGSRIVFPGQDDQGARGLFVRALDEPAARILPGTRDAYNPFFSPDGGWIAFFGDTGPLQKVPVNGGPVVTLAEGNLRNSVGTWTEDGWIVMTQPVADRPGELLRVRAEGGPLEPVPTSDEGAREFVGSVSRIPGVPALLLTVGSFEFLGSLASTSDGTSQSVAVQLLETGERRVLAPGGSYPRALADGRIVYRHSGGLVAERLDVNDPKLMGRPIPLHAITGEGNVVWFDVSPGGTLVFLTRRDDSDRAPLARTDREGRTTPLAAVVEGGDPRLSPDGTRLVLHRHQDVWVLALERGTLTRISSAPGEDETGAWSPDGQWIAWTGSRPGEKRALFRRRADGSGPEERLWSDERHLHVASWTTAGIVVTVADSTNGWDVLLVAPDDADGAKPLLGAKFNEKSPRVSPDGHLLAFVSDETGRDEIYVQSFPEPRGKVQVSIDGGVQPVWRPGTREIVYRGSGKIMSATVGPGDRPSVAAPRPLLDDRIPGIEDGDHTAFAVDHDGSLLAVSALERAPIRDIRIALEWARSAGLDR